MEFTTRKETHQLSSRRSLCDGGKPARLQALPFKGAVFLGAGKKRLDGGRTIIANSVFGPDPIDASEFSEFVEDIGRIQRKPSPLQHNFLRINLTVPGTLKKSDKSYTWDTRPRGDDKVSMW